MGLFDNIYGKKKDQTEDKKGLLNGDLRSSQHSATSSTDGFDSGSLEEQSVATRPEPQIPDSEEEDQGQGVDEREDAPLNVDKKELQPITAYKEEEAKDASIKLAQVILAKIEDGKSEETPITDIANQSHLIRSLKELDSEIDVKVSFKGEFNGVLNHIASGSLSEVEKNTIKKEFLTDLAEADEISLTSMKSIELFVQTAKEQGVRINVDNIRLKGSTLSEDDRKAINQLQTPVRGQQQETPSGEQQQETPSGEQQQETPSGEQQQQQQQQETPSGEQQSEEHKKQFRAENDQLPTDQQQSNNQDDDRSLYSFAETQPYTVSKIDKLATPEAKQRQKRMKLQKQQRKQQQPQIRK